MTAAGLKALIEAAPYSAREARAAGLIDGLGAGQGRRDGDPGQGRRRRAALDFDDYADRDDAAAPRVRPAGRRSR